MCKLKLDCPLGQVAKIITLISLTTYGTADTIFSEDFDEQPDWHSGMDINKVHDNHHSGGADSVQLESTHTIPRGWDMVRQDPTWAPSVGHPDRHEVIEILSGNESKALGGTGKSFVSWRDSFDPGWNRWNSDGILAKHFPEGFDEIYVEFWVTFSNEMIDTYFNTDYKDDSTGSGKLFRIYHWNPEVNNNPFDFHIGENNPHATWGLSGRPESNSGYGFRNSLSFLTRRDGNSEGRYISRDGEIMTSEPSSYISDIEVPKSIRDLKNGGFITSDVADIDQVFGDEETWVKMGFYVKMNSAPGEYDGVFMQWIDDLRIQNINTVNWVESGRDMVQWTVVGIGGNDWFNKYPNEQRVEEWYAIDDIQIATEIPDYLIERDGRPHPPGNVIRLDD